MESPNCFPSLPSRGCVFCTELEKFNHYQVHTHIIPCQKLVLPEAVDSDNVSNTLAKRLRSIVRANSAWLFESSDCK